MIIAALLFLIGLTLSAFFSGCETGLYRVSRTRLVLDGLSGSASARGIVWLLNRPAMFVATTLVGNNLANYVTSLSMVMAVAAMFGANPSVELLGPVLMTPVVFVFGELLPKYLFYHAPVQTDQIGRPVSAGGDSPVRTGDVDPGAVGPRPSEGDRSDAVSRSVGDGAGGTRPDSAARPRGGHLGRRANARWPNGCSKSAASRPFRSASPPTVSPSSTCRWTSRPLCGRLAAPIIRSCWCERRNRSSGSSGTPICA